MMAAHIARLIALTQFDVFIAAYGFGCRFGPLVWFELKPGPENVNQQHGTQSSVSQSSCRDPTSSAILLPMSSEGAIAFIARWAAASASERAHSQPFLCELCNMLGVATPEPTRETGCAFEYDVIEHHPDGGTARTGTRFSVGPLAAAVISILLLGKALTVGVGVTAALMALGVWLHLKD